MAANRECGCQLPASKSISALVRGCFLQKTWLPHSLAPEGVIRTWNNLSVSGQGSNAATCRTCRVSLRRSELAVSFAQWIAVSANLFVSYTSKWPPVLERKLKHQMLLPKMLFSSSLLDCRWTLFSKFVKSFRIHSSSNVNLQPRYLDIWILWTSCTLLGLPRPYELFSWVARLWLYGDAFDTLTIKCLMVQRECQSLSMFLLLLISYATWVSFQWPSFSN